MNGIDYLGLWKIYDALKGQPNYRLELSLSALTRRFNLPRIPVVHDTLKSYGIVVQSKGIRHNGMDCVEVSIDAFGDLSAKTNAVRSVLRRIPGGRRIADRVSADLQLLGGIKAIDCCPFSREDVILGGSVRIMASAGIGANFGRRPPGTTDYRTGEGGGVGGGGLRGIRGAFIGAYGDFGFSPMLSNEGLDVELGGGATGFVGYRGSFLDLRAGGEISGSATFGIIPSFEYKGGQFKGVSQILLKLLGGFPVVGLVFR